ncbi:MAG: DUF4382 domain-containing protein [Gammaproteobacteria bacterium]|nr:DUF4382 domain-containing protein [Gammaproteobacteria bacterium]
MKNGVLLLALSVASLSFYGCGGGSGSSAGRGGVMEGELTIKITDAAVDSAAAVWVQVTGLTLKPDDDSAFDILFDNPLNINLLSLQLGKTEVLLEDVKVPAGKYNWIRMHVNAARDSVPDDSYIELLDGNQHQLNIPSGAETGLKIIKNLEVNSNDDVNLVIDFDLRQSIVLHNGDYDLLPVLRMVDLDDMGSIEGVVDPALLTSAECSDNDPATGNAVYVFAGEDAIPDDIDGNKQTDPVATSSVIYNIETGDYEYAVSYIEEGDYTVAFTCQADLDIIDSDEVIVFSNIENAEVEDEYISVSR